jgi:hypothetical protein
MDARPLMGKKSGSTAFGAIEGGQLIIYRRRRIFGRVRRMAN